MHRVDWENVIAASLKDQWRRYRKKLKRCQRKFTETAVHESRVETRRMLSLVELLGVFLGQRHLKKARRALKEHLDTFDPLRDTQVQLLEVDKHLPVFPELRKFHDALRKRERRCLREARVRVRRLKTRQLNEVVAALKQQLRAQRRHPAQRVRHQTAVMNAVEEAFAQVVELRRRMTLHNAETIHRTRIAFKKFRYMLEALQPVFRELTRRRLAAMQDFQAMLGDLQDTEVLLTRLDKFTGRKPARLKALKSFREKLAHRRAAQIEQCLESADAIFNFWPVKNAPVKPARPAGGPMMQ